MMVWVTRGCPADSKVNVWLPGSSVSALPSSCSATTSPSIVTFTADSSCPAGVFTVNTTVGSAAFTSSTAWVQSARISAGQVGAAQTSSCFFASRSLWLARSLGAASVAERQSVTLGPAA